MKKTIAQSPNCYRKLERGSALLVFAVGFLVVAGTLFLIGNKVSAVTYKFSVYDEVRVISSVPKLDVWSWYDNSNFGSGSAKVLGSEVAGNTGIIQNWPHSGKWQVKWKDGLMGWSDEASLEKVPIAAPSAYKIGDWVLTKASVNLRVSPSLTGGVYKTINSGVLCNLKKGPTMADGYYWWGVTCNLPGMTNVMLFMAEGSWLEKTSSPTQNQPPVVTPSGPATLEAYEGGFWTWSVMDPEGGSYSCNKTKWGDGVEDYEDSHFYVQAGSYTITFSCQDVWGAVGTATATVTVTPSTTGNPPPGGATIGGKAFFKPTIAGPLTLSPDQDGQWSLLVISAGVSYTFTVDWGDGAKENFVPDAAANGSTKIATHKYKAGGIYSIKFTATDNASGVKGTAMTSVGVLDQAILTRFAPGTKIRTKGTVTVMNLLGGVDPATNNSAPPTDFGIKLKFSIGKVSDESIPNFKIMGNPVVFWGGEWWVRIAFPGGTVGWVKESQIEEMCPPLSAAQLSSQNRFVEGECVWIPNSVASSLSARGSVPVSGYPFYGDPSPIGTVKGGNQGVLTSGPTVTNDFVWWQVSWDSGFQGWSVGNWIVSDRSKPRFDGGLLGAPFTPNSTTTIYLSPQGGRVIGEGVNPNGPAVGRWWANTVGTMGWAEFVGGKWWYRVIYTPPSMPILRGWSREEDLFGAGTPGNDVPVTVPSCEAKFIPGDRVMVSPTTFPAMAFSYSDPPGGNLGGDLSLNGRLGTVRNGPQRQNNVCWWQVGYDYPSSRPTLWTDANYLQAPGNNPPQNTTSTPISTSTITIGGITVTAPLAGEIWRVGEMRTISWTAPATIQSVDIQLASGGYIVRNLPNRGTYNWTIPEALLSFSTLSQQQVIYVSPAGTTGQTAPSGVFLISSRELKTGYTVMNAQTVDVRTSASNPNSIAGTQYYGAMGTITDGPSSGGDGTYWYVNYTTGADGWVKDSNLVRLVF